jgi:hypothetical protein
MKQKKARLKKINTARLLSCLESRFFKKDMKVEGILLGKRKGTSRRGMGTREGNGGRI